MKKEAIAIATSDWHFWHVAPVWRSNEPNWLEAMGRQLDQIVQASHTLGVPILNGGDIFDHFNPTPETINFVIQKLAGNWMYAVPGQHDLEHHVLDNLTKTGFHTLQQKWIQYRADGFVHDADYDLDIYFAPWGAEIDKIIPRKSTSFKILLAHRYVWFDESTRYGGPNTPSGKLSGFKTVLQNFDFAIFGDNHIPFRRKIGKCQVINCGTMVRRKLDEQNYMTGYTVLFNDGSIDFHPFNISQDVHLEIKIENEEEPQDLNVSSRRFMQELEAMEQDQIDYRTEIERKIQEIDRKDMEKEFAEIFDNYEGARK